MCCATYSAHVEYYKRKNKRKDGWFKHVLHLRLVLIPGFYYYLFHSLHNNYSVRARQNMSLDLDVRSQKRLACSFVEKNLLHNRKENYTEKYG